MCLFLPDFASYLMLLLAKSACQEKIDFEITTPFFILFQLLRILQYFFKLQRRDGYFEIR
ncbi:MAG: hypothetical protein KIPDCIKN_03562 [Haliscomenobacter sp.]|nr:hypothetical protein [Haliscomenobacter sp.]